MAQLPTPGLDGEEMRTVSRALWHTCGEAMGLEPAESCTSDAQFRESATRGSGGLPCQRLQTD